jgi:cytochrome c oxidase subunit IV
MEMEHPPRFYWTVWALLTVAATISATCGFMAMSIYFS